MPDRAARDTRSIWGEASYYLGYSETEVDLEFIRP